MQLGVRAAAGAVGAALCGVFAVAYVSTGSDAPPVVARTASMPATAATDRDGFSDDDGSAGGDAASAPTPESPPSTVPPSTVPPSTSPTTLPPPTTPPTTMAPAPTTTVFVPDPACAQRVGRDGSLESFVEAARLEIAVVDLWFENDALEAVEPGDVIDVCVGNGIDDRTGDPRLAFAAATEEGPSEPVAAALIDNVVRQQEHLNRLFDDIATTPLAVDGDSGPRTRQRLCATRLAFGLPTASTDLTPGTDESVQLMSATELPPLEHSVTGAPRWGLIDRTCQVMFVGTFDETRYLFITSTGEAGYRTRDQDLSRAFRYNPALSSGGWHDSTDYPVGVDNPLNGNMYKPIYFDNGQAIHGAGSVPHYPASKGCARLRVGDQETLIAFLGLGGIKGELWQERRINFNVTVQGAWARG